MSKKTDAVDDALLASLHKPPTRQPASKPIKPKSAVSAKSSAPKRVAKPIVASKLPEDDPIIRATISIRQSDSLIADEIISAIRGQGARASFSDALKIALRLCTRDEAEIIAAFEQVRAADRRGKQ